MLFNKSNESRLDIIERDLVEIKALLTQKHCCTGATSGTTAGSTTTVNKISQRASYENINVNTTRSAAGIQVAWDITQFEASLPTDHVIRDVRIVADGDKRTYINSNKKTASVILDSSAANLQLEARIKVESPEGIYRYDKVMALDTATDGDKIIPVEPTIPSITKEVTQQELSDALMAEINLLKTKVASSSK